MKTLFDTSVLVAALVERHPFHGRAAPWLQRARAGRFEWVIASHSLAELYSAVTSLPLQPRIPGHTASSLIRDNFPSPAHIIHLTNEDYLAAIQRTAELGLTGGAIYDALIVQAAVKAHVGRLLTFDEEDFRRFWPEGAGCIVVP